MKAFRRMISFTLRQPYPTGKEPLPMDRRLGGPLSQSGGLEEEKILELYKGSNSHPSAIQPVASHYTDCSSWLIAIQGRFKNYLNLGIITCDLANVLVPLSSACAN
jgi:hypothetical protein